MQGNNFNQTHLTGYQKKKSEGGSDEQSGSGENQSQPIDPAAQQKMTKAN